MVAQIFWLQGNFTAAKLWELLLLATAKFDKHKSSNIKVWKLLEKKQLKKRKM